MARPRLSQAQGDKKHHLHAQIPVEPKSGAHVTSHGAHPGLGSGPQESREALGSLQKQALVPGLGPNKKHHLYAQMPVEPKSGTSSQEPHHGAGPALKSTAKPPGALKSKVCAQAWILTRSTIYMHRSMWSPSLWPKQADIGPTIAWGNASRARGSLKGISKAMSVPKLPPRQEAGPPWSGPRLPRAQGSPGALSKARPGPRIGLRQKALLMCTNACGAQV